MPLVSWERYKLIILYLVTSRRFPVVSFDKNEDISIICTDIQTLILIFLLSSYPLCCVFSPHSDFQ